MLPKPIKKRFIPDINMEKNLELELKSLNIAKSLGLKYEVRTVPREYIINKIKELEEHKNNREFRGTLAKFNKLDIKKHNVKFRVKSS